MDRDASGAVELLVGTVGEWPGVDLAPHRFGGTEFRVGEREFGHVHRGGLVDVTFARPIRDALIADGRTGEHHVVPESGWTSYAVRDADDLAGARWLLRLSYLHAALVSRRRPAGAAVLAAVDPAAELDELDPAPEVRAAFDRLLSRA